MARHQNWRTDMKRQAVHDRSVIDHLVEAFHAGQAPGLAAQRPAQSSQWLYHQIRKEWTPRNGGLAEF
jgi:hypothetical protein